jgi:sugar porter (SP) family MFS transporter
MMASSAHDTSQNSLFIWVITIFAALGGFLFGYDTGVIAGAILFIKPEFGLTTGQEEWIIGIVSLGAILGAFAGSPLSDRYGRRKIILSSSLLFIVSALVLSYAPNATFLIVGRIIVGIAIGVSSGTVPLYIAELAPPRNRGALVTINQLCITIGILAAFLIGYAFVDSHGWRWMFGLSALPAALQLVGMFFLPESPRWLIKTRQVSLATKILQKVRLRQRFVDEEIAEIQESLRLEKTGWKELLSPTVLPALVAGVGLTIVQQATGINSVLYYAPTIFQMAGYQNVSSAILATVGVGTINVLATFLAIWLLDRLGRKKLLYIGLGGMIVTLTLLGFGFFFHQESGFLSWLSASCLMAYIAFFAISLGPLGWLINSEIYPLKIRGKAMGVVVFCNWGSNFIITVTFLSLVKWAGTAGAFWLYAIIGIVGLWFISKRLPETKGKTLEQIEGYWRALAKKNK